MTVTDLAPDGPACRSLLLAAAVLLPLPALAAESHRWVDEEGAVHYGDAPPADATRGEHATVRADGTTREKADGVAREQGEAPADDADKKAGPGRRDRVLLQTYSTVEEIERTRVRHLESIDGEIGLAEHRVRRAERKIEQYDRLLEELPDDNEHRAEMQRQRRDAKARLEKRREQLESLRARREGLAQRFAEDIARFRELQTDDGS